MKTGAIPKGQRAQKNEAEFEDEPLDQKFIVHNKEGVEKRVPALHKGWAQRATYVRYQRAPINDDTEGAMDTWIELMEFLAEDLRELLTLPHHRFWSQVVYNPGLHEALESYISKCHRWYEETHTDDTITPLVRSIHRSVFLIYVRMATHKENKKCHITPSVFGDLIYENYLFDINKVLDLCQVYGPANGQLLTGMLSNIFKHQPKYYNDLAEVIPHIRNAIELMEDKLGVSDYNTPVVLNSHNDTLTHSELEEIVYFVLDTFSTLQLFLTLHPPAAKYFLHEGLDLKVCQWYDRVFPSLVHEITRCGIGDTDELLKKINQTRIQLLITFRSLLHHKCLAPLQDTPSQTVVGECVENYMNVISTCAGDKIFIADYCAYYPLQPDLDLFKNHGGDSTMLNFVRDIVKTALNDDIVNSDDANVNLPSSTNNSHDSGKHDVSGMNGYGMVPDDIELASMVSSVQDLLPELGNHFIKQCLQYYSYSTEEVINALLEDNLPPSLTTLDRSATVDPNATTNTTTPPPQPPSPPTASDDKSEATENGDGLLSSRANVYDKDEFDVFNKTQVDRTKIHKGKKRQNIKQDDNDEDIVQKLKAIALQYEERGGTSIYEDEFRYEAEDTSAFGRWTYDDEYDDTYDDNETGNIDEFDADVKRRPAIIGAGRLNAPIKYSRSQESSDKSDVEEDEEGAIDKKDSTTLPQNKEASVRSKNKTSTRGVQRIFNKKSSKPKQPSPEQESSQGPSQNESGPAPTPVQARPEMKPFCENPEVLRERAQQRRMDRDRNRGGRWHGENWRGRDEGSGGGWRGREEGSGGGGGGGGGGGEDRRPRIPHHSTKHSGKSWRQGDGDEERGYRGGKYKEDSNHGQAQSRQYRNKMMHKNEHKRQGAQAKFNKNN